MAEKPADVKDTPDMWLKIERRQLEMDGNIDIDVLLPNGFVITVQCSIDYSLAMLKEEVFSKAKKLPFFNLLLTPSDYIFTTLGPNSEIEELYDEAQSIFSLRLFVPMLRLIEPIGNRKEKEMAHDIAKLSPEEMSSATLYGTS
ncbi:unnamed protein product [Thelazia callipaeda]|uniref:PI3K-ABD domain-containing protein n=1 Tax=Thelazia callipaeda TaxID=103827 RepID=A0A0N5CTT1_THECL|nr:unnamed protein product [Thelazia callipaeda]